MDFFTSIKTCFVKYIDLKGRASRSEFWYFNLFAYIIILCADIMDAGLAGQSYSDYIDSGSMTGPISECWLLHYWPLVTNNNMEPVGLGTLITTVASECWSVYWSLINMGPGTLIAYVVTFLPCTTAMIRRLHDINKSGWWLLLLFTIIGLIPLIYWLVKRSDQNSNDYGSPPLHISEGSYK